MRLLIIEDEAGISVALYGALNKYYSVDIARTGESGLRKAESHSYAAIILDLTLPDISGLEVCKRLRRANFTTPILILSGEAKPISKVTLLDAGADDYITKPFSLEELKARLRVLLRRTGSSQGTPKKIIVGDLVMDTVKHQVERAGQPIELRRKEFALLECLMSHAGSVVTRTLLTNYVWNEDENIWTNTIDVHIKHLRDKVDRPFDVQLIKTVHGLGYKVDTSQAAAQIIT